MRLIDADALIKAIKTDKTAWRFGVPNTLKLMFDWLKIIINDAPTIDPEELRPKGEWIEVDGEVFDCSVCHGIHAAYPYNYCPDCGAKMEVT